METRGRSIPESVTVQIIARLPLRSIARFKSVCKQWNSLIESSYFRSLFVSVHRNSSSSWSLMFPIDFHNPITEAIGFHGCGRWDLPKSLASYIIPFQICPNLPTLDYYYVDSSHGLVWIEVSFGSDKNFKGKSFVGNPISQEWVEIPPPPPDHLTSPFILVTRVVNGVVSGFKVVRICYDEMLASKDRTYLWKSMYVYSSETGTWAFKRLWSSCPLRRSCLSSPLSLNGILYVWDKRLDGETGAGVIVSYDLDAEEDIDECRIIPLPLHYNGRCLTSSCGDVIYVEVLHQRLNVWKLKNNNSDGKWWQLTSVKINIASVGFDVDCFPLGMNPFDSDLVYLWSRQQSCLVSGNLRTQKFIVHKKKETWSDGEGSWRINTSDSKEYMEAIHVSSVITLSQFVLPHWMDPVPRPPS